VRQCAEVRKCKRQCVAVRITVCDSAAACRVARGSVQQCGIVSCQCAWQCAAVYGSAAVCGNVAVREEARQCSKVCGNVWLFVFNEHIRLNLR
jgi:hypothetical protein